MRYPSSWSFFRAAAACSPAMSALKRSRSGTPASRASSSSRGSAKPFSLEPSAYAAEWKAAKRSCCPAAQAARAAASDSAPKMGKLRHSMRRVPLSTYFFTSSGSVSRANFPQYPHLKSEYSMSTTGASARPRASLSPASRRARARSAAEVSSRGAAAAGEEPAEPCSAGAVACQETMPRVTAARATPAEISSGFAADVVLRLFLDEDEDIRVLQRYG